VVATRALSIIAKFATLVNLPPENLASIDKSTLQRRS
jgi:hypothetical protein